MARESITAGATAGGTRRAATHYGPRGAEDKAPAKHCIEQGREVYELQFGYDDLPTFGLDKLIQSLPANCRIEQAELKVLEAFAGGTSYNIGLYEEDGTVIDADGLFAGTLLAAIDAVGETVDGAGALVKNTAGIGAAAGQIVVAATGTFTAGRAVLRVEYTPLYDRARDSVFDQ